MQRVAAPPLTRARPRHASVTAPTVWLWPVLCLVHVGLAVALRASAAFAFLHMAGTVAVLAWIAVTAKRSGHLAAACAYVAGSEVLWRVLDASPFYEGSKYAIFGALLVGWARKPKYKGVLYLPLALVALLAPGAALTVDALGIGARELISFNLSGPLVLAAAVLFFARDRYTDAELRTIAWTGILPVVGLGTVSVLATLGAASLEFGGESNFTVAGGFGPNQVSAALSLGAVWCLLLLSLGERRRTKLVALGLLVFFLAQSALTFSRGGVYNFAASLLFVLVVLLARPRLLVPALAVSSLVIALGMTLVLPRLDTFTGGALTERFADRGTSNRGDLIAEDLDIWRRHRVFGIGAGLSPTGHAGGAVAHTEPTRLLAEHGTLGLLALVLLCAAAAKAVGRAGSVNERVWTVACLGWVLAESVHSAMRISAVGLLFGLAFVRRREGGAAP